MDSRLILWPGVAMVALTACVWVVLYVQRLGEMQRERIHPQQLANSAQAAARLADKRGADNFRNLFELPVLFYFALLVAFVSGIVDSTLLALAWTFVALRAAHSLIHCSYNRVMHRFVVYAASTLTLWALWVVLGMKLWQ